MLLAFDVGNTTTAVGVSVEDEWLLEMRLPTLREAGEEYFAEHLLPSLRRYFITEIAIASVVPPLEVALEAFCTRSLSCKPLFLRSECESGVRVHYDPPASLGVDRLCNAVAGLEIYGAPLIVIDFGTATKLEAIGESGEYLGGAILPGVGVSIEALLSRAAKLRKVEWTIPERAIGTTTIEALQSGFVFGFAGQAEGLIARFREEMGGEVPVVATGGWASHVAPACPSIQKVAPSLTLEGVRRLYARQRAGRES